MKWYSVIVSGNCGHVQLGEIGFFADVCSLIKPLTCTNRLTFFPRLLHVPSGLKQPIHFNFIWQISCVSISFFAQFHLTASVKNARWTDGVCMHTQCYLLELTLQAQNIYRELSWSMLVTIYLRNVAMYHKHRKVTRACAIWKRTSYKLHITCIYATLLLSFMTQKNPYVCLFRKAHALTTSLSHVWFPGLCRISMLTIS